MRSNENMGHDGRSAILVLGMHRSGTSALAGVLAKNGCTAPLTQIDPGRQNRHGFFESKRVARLDDRILETLGSCWHDWRLLDLGEGGAAGAGGFREAAASLLEEEFAAADLIVLKDPRICRLAPIWIDALAAASYRPLPVLIHRDPLEVAQSLRARNGFPMAFGVLLWLRHVLDAERLTRGRTRAFTSYEGLLADWRSVVATLGDRLGLSFPLGVEEAGPEVDGFLSADLRHFAKSPDDDLPDLVLMDRARECFGIMQRWAAGGEDPRDHGALDGLGSVLTTAAWTFSASRAINAEVLEAKLDAARAQSAALEDRVAQEVEGRRVSERTLEQVHGALLDLASRNQELDRERARQVQELAALARLVRDSEAQQARSLAEVRKSTDRAAELKSLLTAAERRHAETLKEARKRGERTSELKGLLKAAERLRDESLEDARKKADRIVGLQAELNDAKTAHDEIDGRYRQIVGSSSWKVTAPLRHAIRKVRGSQA